MGKGCNFFRSSSSLQGLHYRYRIFSHCEEIENVRLPTRKHGVPIRKRISSKVRIQFISTHFVRNIITCQQQRGTLEIHLELGVSSRVRWSVVQPDRKVTRMGSIIPPHFLSIPIFKTIRSAVLQLLQAYQWTNYFIAAIQGCK
jgi:hypothetical protein